MLDGDLDPMMKDYHNEVWFSYLVTEYIKLLHKYGRGRGSGRGWSIMTIW